MRIGYLDKLLTTLIIVWATAVLTRSVIADTVAVSASNLRTAVPKDAGISAETLAGMSSVVQTYVNRELVPGAVTLVARKGKVIHHGAIGYLDVASKTPLKRDSIFRLYSMTKPIVSVALMMLYDEGRFALDDPISKWLPEFASPVVAIGRTRDENGVDVLRTEPAREAITFRHVLTHSGGLASGYPGDFNGDQYSIAELPRRPDEVIGDFVTRYAGVPLSYHPGEDWQYGRSTCVVGRLVEVISGMSLNDFLRQRILGPLKMVDTHYYVPKEKWGRFASLYTSGKDGKVQLVEMVDENYGTVRGPEVYYAGSGGLHSTAADYFLFSQMMLNEGELEGVRILKEETARLMVENHIGDLEVWGPPPRKFGLGFGITQEDHPAWGSQGTYSWGGAGYTSFWVDPRQETVAIIMSQVVEARHVYLSNVFAMLVNQSIIAPIQAPARSENDVGTSFTYVGSPRFTIEFPMGSTRTPMDAPAQVFAANTPDGVTFQASVADRRPGTTLEDSANLYGESLLTTGIGSDIRVLSNQALTLKDGTPAFRAEIDWFFVPLRVRLKTQYLSAVRGDKVVYLTAHSLTNPESVIPILESLRFDVKQ